MCLFICLFGTVFSVPRTCPIPDASKALHLTNLFAQQRGGSSKVTEPLRVYAERRGVPRQDRRNVDHPPLQKPLLSFSCCAHRKYRGTGMKEERRGGRARERERERARAQCGEGAGDANCILEVIHRWFSEARVVQKCR